MNIDGKVLCEFFEEAYWLQHGEFFPEVHAKNLAALARWFPLDPVIIDALYRILPHFDHVVRVAAEQFLAGSITARVAFGELEVPLFFYISDGAKRHAWEFYSNTEPPR